MKAGVHEKILSEEQSGIIKDETINSQISYFQCENIESAEQKPDTNILIDKNQNSIKNLKNKQNFIKPFSKNKKPIASNNSVKCQKVSSNKALAQFNQQPINKSPKCIKNDKKLSNLKMKENLSQKRVSAMIKKRVESSNPVSQAAKNLLLKKQHQKLIVNYEKIQKDLLKIPSQIDLTILAEKRKQIADDWNPQVCNTPLQFQLKEENIKCIKLREEEFKFKNKIKSIKKEKLLSYFKKKDIPILDDQLKFNPVSNVDNSLGKNSTFEEKNKINNEIAESGFSNKINNASFSQEKNQSNSNNINKDFSILSEKCNQTCNNARKDKVIEENSEISYLQPISISHNQNINVEKSNKRLKTEKKTILDVNMDSSSKNQKEIEQKQQKLIDLANSFSKKSDFLSTLMITKLFQVLSKSRNFLTIEEIKNKVQKLVFISESEKIEIIQRCKNSGHMIFDFGDFELLLNQKDISVENKPQNIHQTKLIENCISLSRKTEELKSKIIANKDRVLNANQNEIEDISLSTKLAAIPLINCYQKLEILKNNLKNSEKHEKVNNSVGFVPDGLIYQEMNANFRLYFDDIMLRAIPSDPNAEEYEKYENVKNILQEFWVVDKTEENMRKLAGIVELNKNANIIQKSFQNWKKTKYKKIIISVEKLEVLNKKKQFEYFFDRIKNF